VNRVLSFYRSFVAGQQLYWRRGAELRVLFYWAVLGIVGVMVLYPVFLILLSSFQSSSPGQATSYTLDAWRLVLSDPGILSAIKNTITVTLARQALAFPLAILLAWTLARTNIPGSHWLEFLFWIAFFLPTLPVAMGWILLLDPDYGLLNRLLTGLPFIDKPPFNIYSFWGIVWAHLATNTVAIKVMLLTPAFRNMDAALEDASRVSGASALGTLTRIIVPIMTPAILIVLLMSIIASLQAFELELVLGFPFRFYVYSTLIYSLLHDDPPMFPAATALSTIILVLIVPLIFLHRRAIRRRDYATVSGKFKLDKLELGRWRLPVFFLVLAVAMMVTAVPLVFLLLGTFMKLFGFFNVAAPWTLANWSSVLTDQIFLSSLWNTLVIATGTALSGVVVFTIIGYIIVRTRFVGRSALDLTSWLPSTLPGIILAVGLLSFFLTTPWLRPLYGTVIVMIVAIVINRMTLGVQLIKSNFVQLSSELEEAATVSGGSWWHTFRHILLPLITPTLLLVGALSFISEAREVSTVALLATTGTRPISLLQLDFMVEGNYEGGAVVGVIVVLMTTVVALFARVLGLRVGIHH